MGSEGDPQMGLLRPGYVLPNSVHLPVFCDGLECGL
jgi:hypothetical protein